MNSMDIDSYPPLGATCPKSRNELPSLPTPATHVDKSQNPDPTPPNPNPTPDMHPSAAPTPNPWSKPPKTILRPPKRFNLRFIPPVTRERETFGVCSSENVAGELKVLDNTLVGFVLGKRPSFSLVRGSLLKQWKLSGSVEILQLIQGGFGFRFSNIEDRDSIMEIGVFYVGGQRLFVRAWERNIHSGGVMGLKKVPLWITLPGLPLHLWGEESLSVICSVLGTPMYTDGTTAMKSRWIYARACIEFNGESPLMDAVTIEDDVGNIFKQPVLYDWKPPQCLTCGVFGHDEDDCISTPCADMPGWKSAKKGLAEARNNSGGDSSVSDILANSVLKEADLLRKKKTMSGAGTRFSLPPQLSCEVSHGEIMEKSIVDTKNSDVSEVSDIVKPRESRREIEDSEMGKPAKGLDSVLNDRKINASHSFSSLLQNRSSKFALHGWNPSRVKKKSHAGHNLTRNPNLLPLMTQSDSDLALGHVSCPGPPGDSSCGPASSSVEDNIRIPGQSKSAPPNRQTISNSSKPALLTNRFSIFESDVDSFFSAQPVGQSLSDCPPFLSLRDEPSRDTPPIHPSCSTPPLNQSQIKNGPLVDAGPVQIDPPHASPKSGKTPPNILSGLPRSVPHSTSAGRTPYPSRYSTRTQPFSSVMHVDEGPGATAEEVEEEGKEEEDGIEEEDDEDVAEKADVQHGREDEEEDEAKRKMSTNGDHMMEPIPYVNTANDTAEDIEENVDEEAIGSEEDVDEDSEEEKENQLEKVDAVEETARRRKLSHSGRYDDLWVTTTDLNDPRRINVW